MRFNHKIHSKGLFIKSILGRLESVFSNPIRKPNDVLVLNYHGIQKKFLPNFDKQIKYLVNNYSPISPKEFESFVLDGFKLDLNQPRLLITFDDGIKNNLNALSILEKYKVKAYFFVVPDFVDSESQKDFFKKNIRPEINSDIDNEVEDFTAMNWIELESLINTGHSIGSHSSTHTMTKETDSAKLDYEIYRSKSYLEEKLRFPINTFCSINNSFLSLSNEAVLKLKDHFTIHFTTVAGDNSKPNSLAIRRVNIESHWPDYAFRYAIGNWELKRWKEKSELIDEKMAVKK